MKRTVLDSKTTGNWEVRLIEFSLNGHITYRVTRLHTVKLDHYGDTVTREYKKLTTAQRVYKEMA